MNKNPNPTSPQSTSNQLEWESTSNQLEWGNHNPRLTDDNFIDRAPKTISDQKEIPSTIESTDLSKEEPDRNRQGVKEGHSK